ncbi:hypothetical protein CIG75_07275 [Tumebacillus algifaecis]|uniref:Uncharacterized protein n=1 Tax=Tumebacillus algifaecis TaxID=1214604 RepID=A0A223D0A2_9BACL|nr:hypothetical protein [Tumebacillus algifaecis]ASS74797.1 hypothetical protein CIG75_07275 [Tumebacillus algifaecis]
MSVCPPEINKSDLQKLLHKVVLKRFFDNWTKEIKENKILQVELSRAAGRNDGAFNKSFKNLEDIQITTFLRYWSALNNVLVEKGKKPLDFIRLLDHQTAKTLIIASELNIFEFQELAERERDFFIGVKVYIDVFLKEQVYYSDSKEVLAYQAFIKRYITEEDRNV